jgi:hypothetical protein
MGQKRASSAINVTQQNALHISKGRLLFDVLISEL